ncbi:hypothetical protein LZ31DRAFT_198637 [Colletotrichum somersetense]|nr:hypothetical protein LZ31DRAFT_198637 [Colletotrichum somersetense]
MVLPFFFFFFSLSLPQTNVDLSRGQVGTESPIQPPSRENPPAPLPCSLFFCRFCRFCSLIPVALRFGLLCPPRRGLNEESLTFVRDRTPRLVWPCRATTGVVGDFRTASQSKRLILRQLNTGYYVSPPGNRRENLTSSPPPKKRRTEGRGTGNGPKEKASLVDGNPKEERSQSSRQDNRRSPACFSPGATRAMVQRGRGLAAGSSFSFETRIRGHTHTRAHSFFSSVEQHILPKHTSDTSTMRLGGSSAGYQGGRDVCSALKEGACGAV